MPSPGDHTGYRAETQGWAIRDLEEAGGGLTGWSTDEDGNLVAEIENRSIKLPADALGAGYVRVEAVNGDGDRLANLLMQDVGDGTGGWMALQVVDPSSGNTVSGFQCNWHNTYLMAPANLRFYTGGSSGDFERWRIDTDGKLIPTLENVVAAAATDPASTQALANSLRSILISLGILSAS